MAIGSWLLLFACAGTSMAMRIQKTGATAGAKNSEAETDQSKWCWFSGSSSLKDYYFEGMFDLPDSEDHTALQLWRHPNFPKLRIHKVSQWVVRTPPKEGQQDENAHLTWFSDVEDPSMMQWTPACMKPGGQADCRAEDVVEIDLLKVAYIQLVPEVNVTDPNTGKVEQEMGLRIVFPDGSSTEFMGGVYLPRALMVSAMKRAEANYEKFSGLSQEAKDQASRGDNMVKEGMRQWKESFVDGVGTGVGTGAGVGIGVGAASILLGVPLYGSALASMLAGAGAGLVGGSAAGLALGAALGTVLGGGAALYDFHKQKHELGISAAEKLWDKLECHQKMIRCNKTFVVPKGQTCPE